MAKPPAQELYEAHHAEFESWFTRIHPNHDLSFNWIAVFDSGWYSEPMAQGAWIAWISLTNKGYFDLAWR